MDLKTAIQILGLQKCQSPNDVKVAFRDLAHQYHPDKNTKNSASDDFNRIVQAYEYCLDHFAELQIELRESLHWRDSPQGTKPLENFDDIFSDLFGLTGTQKTFGYEAPQSLQLTPQNLLHGCVIEQKFQIAKTCSICTGKGGWKPKLCRYCFGAGSVTESQMHKEVLCPKCNGRGREIEVPCDGCDGYGKTFTTENLRVVIPSHLFVGQKLWLTGENLKTKQKQQLYLHIASSTAKIHENYGPIQRAWKAFLWLFKNDA